ncbi:MAG TPA: rhodanese-like domain-containing protein [Burkholderiaceae bacterium]|nr:rhodanese-like domain-containing protein [Burkholderiaceae bacterium]
MQFVTENIFLILVAFLSGGMLLWPLINRQLGGPSLSTLQATRLINDSGAVLLDVRDSAEFSNGHLPNAKNIPVPEIEKRAKELPAGKPVIVVCDTGSRAARAAAALRKLGRGDVFCLDGGIRGWQAAGLPVVK